MGSGVASPVLPPETDERVRTLTRIDYEASILLVTYTNVRLLRPTLAYIL